LRAVDHVLNCWLQLSLRLPPDVSCLGPCADPASDPLPSDTETGFAIALDAPVEPSIRAEGLMMERCPALEKLRNIAQLHIAGAIVQSDALWIGV
jgi:hypothetical protein